MKETFEHWNPNAKSLAVVEKAGEICPERWQNFYFDSGLSAFDLPPLLRKDPTP